jgi:type IV pilus assembly protein PilM
MAELDKDKFDTFVAIDIGSYSLKFAYMELVDQGFSLKTLAHIPIPNYEARIDPEQREMMSKEDVRQHCLKELRQLLTTKLTELIYDNEIQTKQAITFASNRDITIRCLEVPTQTDRTKYPEVIKAEANKQMPFSMNNAILGHTIVDTMEKEDGEWKQVMAAALQKDTIEHINANLKGGVLACDGILTLPQSLELALGTQMAPYAEGDKKVAIIHCGDSATAVMIYKNNKLQFFRDVNMGGGTITDAIFEGGEIDGAQYKPSTYEEATELKHRLGIIPPDDMESLKGVEKFAAEQIFDTVEKIFQHIQLSISFYVSQANESGVDLAILSGGTAGMTNFKEFVEESLEIPVEIAKPFNNVHLGRVKYSQEDMNKDAPCLAPILGVALYDGKNPNIINFLDVLNPNRKDKKPAVAIGNIGAKFSGKFSIEKFLPSLSLELNETNARIGAAILIGLFLLICFIPVFKINKKLNGTKNDIKKMSARISKIQQENGNISELLQQQASLKKYADFEDNLTKLKLPTSRVIMELIKITPNQIFLKSLDLNLSKDASTFSLTGHADSSDSVFEYLSVLGMSEIFKNSMLRSTEEALIDESRYFIKFGLSGSLNTASLSDQKKKDGKASKHDDDDYDDYDDFDEMEEL